MMQPKLVQEHGTHDKYLPGFLLPLPNIDSERTIFGSTGDGPIPAVINARLFALGLSVCKKPEQLNPQTHSAF